MATLPEKFARAQGAFGEILRRFNLLRDVVRPWTDVEGKGGIKVTVAEANVVIDAQELASRIGEVEAAVATTAAPFTLYDASSGGTLKVCIRPGTVNGISPTFTDASPAGVLSDDPPPLLTITATRYFWLKVVATFGAPDTYEVTVENTATGSAPGSEDITATGFESYLYLGRATVASGAISAIHSPVQTNLGCDTGGTINAWWAAP